MHHRNTRSPRAARAVTLVEIMVVVAVIAALIAIVLPALGIVRRQAELATSQANLRTVAALMSAYSLDNRDHVVPSQFDYSTSFTKTMVRSASPAGASPNTGALLKGSWADILWTAGNFGPLMPVENSDIPNATWDYRYDSPDYWAYFSEGRVTNNPFRSKAELKVPLNSLNADTDARPFGEGAGIRERGQPGYFAANDFFDARPNAQGASNWYTNAMIRNPGISVYAVDSRAGETIPLPSVAPDAWKPAAAACEVEFRYVGDVTCLLYLDGHVTNQTKWIDLADLANNRQTRVERLDQRN